MLLFVVQRGDCESIEPADDVDPRYGAALRNAVRAGVEVLALRVRVAPSRIALEGAIPVRSEYTLNLSCEIQSAGFPAGGARR